MTVDVSCEMRLWLATVRLLLNFLETEEHRVVVHWFACNSNFESKIEFVEFGLELEDDIFIDGPEATELLEDSVLNDNTFLQTVVQDVIVQFVVLFWVQVECNRADCFKARRQCVDECFAKGQDDGTVGAVVVFQCLQCVFHIVVSEVDAAEVVDFLLDQIVHTPQAHCVEEQRERISIRIENSVRRRVCWCRDYLQCTPVNNGT